MFRKFLKRHLAGYYMLTASLFFAGTGVFAKILSENLPSVEVVFFRNFFGFIFIAILLIKTPPVQKGGKFWLLLTRGITGAISMTAFFYNIANIGLAEAFTFSKTSPIFLVLIMAFFFKEKINFYGWISVLVGFIGIVFVIQPHFGFKVTDVMGIISGIFAAMAYTSMRELCKFYDTRVIIFWFLLIAFLLPLSMLILGEFGVVSGKFAFLFPSFIMPNFVSWLMVFAMGILGLFYQSYLTKSYAAAKKASNVAVLSYTDVLFSLIFGIILGDNLPNILAFLGIILIISSGILIAVKNK